jgi:hypothetical protein
MVFTETTNQRVVVMFDPNRPWKEQQPDRLPPPDGPGTYVDQPLVWSPDGTKLMARTFGTNAITEYDVASRSYRKAGNLQGTPLAWLKDGRLLVARGTEFLLADPITGAARPITLPAIGARTLQDFRLSRDGRLAYFNLSSQDTDVWMVTVK